MSVKFHFKKQCLECGGEMDCEYGYEDPDDNIVVCQECGAMYKMEMRIVFEKAEEEN